MSVHEEKKKNAKKKEVLKLPRLDMRNHEEIIQELCDMAMKRSEEEEVLHFMEWIKNRYLTKVREEHPEEGDSEATQLNRVVWSGKLRELVFQHYEKSKAMRNAVEKPREACCCACFH